MSLRHLAAIHERPGERQVIVTEVTRMSGGLVCVAGIDLHNRNMVRPLQGDGSNGEERKWVAGEYMMVGNILSLEPAEPGDPAYPDASEDYRVSKVLCLAKSTASELYDVCRETASMTVNGIFEGHLADQKYVVAGTRCRSLGCLMVTRSRLTVSESYGKVHVSFQDRTRSWHNLAVTDLATKDAGDADVGAKVLASRLNAVGPSTPVALRLGLARAWDGGDKAFVPKRCYIQLNGLVLPV